MYWQTKRPSGVAPRTFVPPRPVYRETEEEKERREHFEFGAKWGVQTPKSWAPRSHRRDPYDVHYDPYEYYEEARSEQRPHWTDDDEKFELDFNRKAPREIYRSKKKSKKSTGKKEKRAEPSEREAWDKFITPPTEQPEAAQKSQETTTAYP